MKVSTLRLLTCLIEGSTSGFQSNFQFSLLLLIKKQDLRMELFTELPEKSNSDSSLGMGLWQALLPSPVAARLLVFTFTIVVRLFVFRAIVELGRVGLE